MCTIVFALDYHPRYKLVMAANRDEFYQRPTQSAAFWSEYPDLLAGKDLLQGGTWMGITKTGRWAALTNYRDPRQNKHGAPSRGALVHNYLIGGDTPDVFMERLFESAQKYDGYNLLAGTPAELYYFSNREPAMLKVQPGLHGLSNSLLDVCWPKVYRSLRHFKDCLRKEEIEVDKLFSIMADKQQAPDHELPKTGVSLELERLLSSVFIAGENYGTRSTSILLVDRRNHVRFWEKSFMCGNQDNADMVFNEFSIEG
ncbi:MAG: NRDE family protein [Syntrophomonadaceae bacterium]